MGKFEKSSILMGHSHTTYRLVNIEPLRDNVEDGGADHISPMLNRQKIVTYNYELFKKFN